MKTVKMFGKSVSLAVILSLVTLLVVAPVGAALLTYYGSVTSDVIVDQAILLDGASLPGSNLVADVITGAGGDTIVGEEHYLTSQSENKIIVDLVTLPVYDPAIADVYPMYKLDSIEGDDAVSVELDASVPWSTFTGVSFDYIIDTDNWENLPEALKTFAVGPWIPQINIRLRDSATLEPEFGLAWHSLRTGITGEVGTPSSITYLKGDFYVYDIKFDLIEGSILYKDAPIDLKNQLDLLVFNSFSQQAGDTSIDPNNDPQAQPNEALSSQIVWVGNYDLNVKGIVINPDGYSSGYDAVRDIVDFRMVYELDIESEAGTYSVATNVKPIELA